MNERFENTEAGIDLFEYWKVVLRWKRLIIAVSGAAFILSLTVALILPKKYEAVASVMPPSQDDPLSTGMMSAFSGGISKMASGILGTKSPSDLWVGILKSQNVMDGVIEKFNLRKVYEEDTLSDARKELKSNISIDKTKEDIITVTVEDKDPVLAAKIANAFVEELDRVNKGTVMTSGQRTRAFIETRLIEAKAELSRLEEVLKSFQEANKAVKLDDQSKAIIDAIGTVKGQLMAKEVELETLMSYATPANPQVQLLKSEVDGLKSKLKDLEDGGGRHRKDIFIPTDTIPNLAFQYAKILRDAKVQEKLFGLLTEQYELARIQEAKDSPTVQILDTAKVPEKSKPKAVVIVAVSTVLSFLLSVLGAFFLEYAVKMRGKGA